MRYLTGEEILVIHAKIIDETGGAYGVRDVGLFLSIIERPKMKFAGAELYEGIFKKAAVYFESLARYHVFVDGNKRTAVAAAARFLFLNDYELTVTNKELEDFTLEVAQGRVDFEVIAKWFEENTKEL